MSLFGKSPGSFTSGQTTGFRNYNGYANRRRAPARDWQDWPTAIDSIVERLRGVVIENRDAAEVMLQHDGPETLHFVDPPYVHTTRNMQRGNAAYAHEMTDDDHRALAGVLRGLQGMVMLCGYPCVLYEELFGDWDCVQRKSMADGARARTECLWFNPAASRLRADAPLFAPAEVGR